MPRSELATLQDRPRPRCHVIATGGTIAMKIDARVGGPMPALTGDDLVDAVPRLRAIADITVCNLFNKPSDHLDAQDWRTLASATAAALADERVDGVLISHGTDTLEETAWFLDLTVTCDKPVVLVGAQRNASALDFDGPRNLLAGVRACVAPACRGLGVIVAMNEELHAAREVTKTHTSSVASFGSGGFGLLGTVSEQGVAVARRPVARPTFALAGASLPRVDIVAMHAGADGLMVRAALAHGSQGLVVQALGLGNVSRDLAAAIGQALDAGVPVVIASRCPQGSVAPVYGFEGGGLQLQARGAVFAGDLSPQKARILLMLALQAPKSTTALQRLFDR